MLAFSMLERGRQIIIVMVHQTWQGEVIRKNSDLSASPREIIHKYDLSKKSSIFNERNNP
jgi:hypothetical protein